MLGIILLYVGMVLINNGIATIYQIKDNSTAVMNIFTGVLGLILNIVAISYGVIASKSPLFFYGSAMGLLFSFTYLFVAINTIFKLDQRLYGWYSLFVTINAVIAGVLCFYGYGGNVYYGLIWFAWAILWFTGFIENVLKKNLGKTVGYLAVCEGIITAWIPGFLMLLNLWPK